MSCQQKWRLFWSTRAISSLLVVFSSHHRQHKIHVKYLPTACQSTFDDNFAEQQGRECRPLVAVGERDIFENRCLVPSTLAGGGDAYNGMVIVELMLMGCHGSVLTCVWGVGSWMLLWDFLGSWSRFVGWSFWGVGCTIGGSQGSQDYLGKIVK